MMVAEMTERRSMFKRIQNVPKAKPATVPAARVIPEAPAPAPVSAAPVAAPAQQGMKLPKLSAAFLRAGKALFTVSNGKGEHYTFKVRGREGEWKGRKTMTYFVSVKTHDGGRFPYAYIGLLNDNGTIKTTAKSKFLPGTREYDVAAWACGVVTNGKMIPDSYEIAHAGKCGRCGRTLTDPASIEHGIGPECRSIMGF